MSVKSGGKYQEESENLCVIFVSLLYLSEAIVFIIFWIVSLTCK